MINHKKTKSSTTTETRNLDVLSEKTEIFTKLSLLFQRERFR